ncbi:MAG: hypothetical protein QM767_26475 [Anaeromyxobacter sp.]
MSGLLLAALAWLVGSVLFSGLLGLFMRCGHALQDAEERRWAALVELPELDPAALPSEHAA